MSSFAASPNYALRIEKHISDNISSSTEQDSTTMAATGDSASISDSYAEIPNIPHYDPHLRIPSDSDIYPEDGADDHGNDENEKTTRQAPTPVGGPLTAQTSPVWAIVRSGAINFVMPFINGLMLGFGELVAHEFAFRWGWTTTKVSFACPCLLVSLSFWGSVRRTDRSHSRPSRCFHLIGDDRLPLDCNRGGCQHGWWLVHTL